uniref:N-acetyltransferase ESCO acetyl-transferase domain-containing protein n=1 Tax=Pyrodinium bahamense TaxID=73915 RepID=A0A7R9ZX41_9DINO
MVADSPLRLRRRTQVAMLAAHRYKRPRTVFCSKAAVVRRECQRPARQSQKQPQQALLAVARCCRECGARLGALEGALHHCTLSLEWPHTGATEAVGGPWLGAGVGAGGATVCRLVRLGSGLLAPAARAQFGALWDFVRGDLSHGLDQPAPERVAAGAAAVLLGLRGRKVVGLLWAERLEAGQLVECVSEGTACGGALQGAALGRRSPSARAALGVVLVWVRRSERRRGLATAMVDAMCRYAAGPGCRPVPREAVAFSQPTDMGLAFARSYSDTIHGGGVLVYHP